MAKQQEHETDHSGPAQAAVTRQLRAIAAVLAKAAAEADHEASKVPESRPPKDTSS